LEEDMERKKYPKEFKKNAVELLITTGKTQKALSDELGIPYGMIGRWKREFDLSKPENRDLKTAADTRIAQLEKENAILRQEREILKKAMGIALSL
jgi:transposase